MTTAGPLYGLLRDVSSWQCRMRCWLPMRMSARPSLRLFLRRMPWALGSTTAGTALWPAMSRSSLQKSAWSAECVLARHCSSWMVWRAARSLSTSPSSAMCRTPSFLQPFLLKTDAGGRLKVAVGDGPITSHWVKLEQWSGSPNALQHTQRRDATRSYPCRTTCLVCVRWRKAAARQGR